MSNRDALRRLSRKFPAPPEIEKIMNDLRDREDMSVAIMAPAIVEAALERLMIEKFKYKGSGLIGQIFLNRGPLSDFHGKILVSHAFGIITPNIAEELHSIKVIRNTFAHAKVPITFDHGVLAREVASLKMQKAVKATEKEANLKLELSNKGWFLLITRILLIMMDSMTKHPGTADDALKDALGA